MEQKRTVVYPYSALSVADIQRNLISSDLYQFTSLVAPRGLALDGKDAGYADNRKNIGIFVSSDLINALKNTDALFVPSGKRNDRAFWGIFEHMCTAANMGKDIISCIQLTDIEEYKLSNECKIKGSSFINVQSDTLEWKDSSFPVTHDTAIPVIFVSGLLSETNEQEIVYILADRFKRDGLNVTAVGFRPEMNFFGFHNSEVITELINGRFYGGSVQETVCALNYYFYNLEMKEQTDIFIVHIPGALIETPDYPNDCGIFAHIISSAIKPSAIIAGSLYARYTENTMLQMHNEFLTRFGCELSALHISNKTLVHNSSVQKRKLESLYRPYDDVINIVNQMTSEGLRVFNINDLALCESVYQQLLQDIWED